MEGLPLPAYLAVLPPQPTRLSYLPSLPGSLTSPPCLAVLPSQPTWLSYRPKSQGHCSLGGESGKEGELLTWPCRCSVPNEAQWLIPLKFVTHPRHHRACCVAPGEALICLSFHLSSLSIPLPSLSVSSSLLPLFTSAMSDKVPAEASPAVCSCNQRPPPQHSR